MPRCLLSFWVATGVAVSLCSEIRAQLVCAQPSVNVGEVKAGQALSHRFTLANRSGEAAQITATQPSCGCLTPRLGERRLSPGAIGVLLLEINTLTAPAGPNSWHVKIACTSGRETYELTLTILATVIAEITVEPAALVLQTRSTASAEVTLIDGRPHPLRVTDLRPSSPHLAASLATKQTGDDSANRTRIHVAVQPGFPDGRHDETLQIFTSDPQYPELRIPVTVLKQARSAIQATPGELVFPAGSGPLPARVVLLRGSEDRPVEIARVESDDPSVTCTTAKGPGNLATLRVKVEHAKVPQGGLRTALHVHFADAALAPLSIPVSASAR
jgi:hypothetical protein